MAKIKLANNKIIEDYTSPYIVAEINTSHFGNIDIAKEMIHSLKEMKCDCVKFQSWTVDTLYSNTYYEENPIAQRMVKKLSLSEEDLFNLASYANSIGIDFASTPYSEKEVLFLIDECKVPFIKIASMELNNYPFLEFIADTKIPIILSTGMGTYEEIDEAVNRIAKKGNDNLCILHCVSNYPTQPNNMNLNNITSLRSKFNKYPIGFSDHSLGIEVPIASVGLGVCLIEKHFTIDNSRIGMDNQMAAMPNEMSNLIKYSKNASLAMGSYEREIGENEILMRSKMRRSIVAAKDLKKGEIIDREMLTVKRPGSGLLPEKIESLIGKKIKRDINIDTIISSEDFS